MLKRKFRLELTGKVTKTIEDLRIDFSSSEELSLGNRTSAADTCEISIYNLSAGSFKELTTAEELLVKLYTGYEGADALDLTFTGKVSNVVGFKKRPNHITTIYAIPEGRANAEKKTVKYVGSSDDTVESYINNVVALMEMKPQYYHVSDSIKNRKYRNASEHKYGLNLLGQLGKEMDLMFRAEGTTIKVTPTVKALRIADEASPLIIKPSNLRGTPSAGTTTMKILHRLDSTIETGYIIDATKLTNVENGSPNGIASMSGVEKSTLHYADEMAKWAVNTRYQIFKLRHYGSNYTSEFITEIDCVYFNPVGTGGQ